MWNLKKVNELIDTKSRLAVARVGAVGLVK